MATTPNKLIRYPTESYSADIALWMQQLALDVEAALPQVQASPPGHLNGRMWVNSTTGKAWISDGTSWRPIGGSDVAQQGIPVAGAYDASKPVLTLFRRFNQLADANGLIVASVPNTWIGFPVCIIESTSGGFTAMLRPDLTNTAQVVFQIRDTGNFIKANTNFVGQIRVDYQQ